MLKPQDIFVMLKLVAMGRRPWLYSGLAMELGMSASQLHAAVKRSLASRLAVQREDAIAPHIQNVEEFLVHGLKYVFPAERGELTRGIPTGSAAPPLDKLLVETVSEPPPVWPDPAGHLRGLAFAPLCRHAAWAVQTDKKLHELLALVDAIRGGRARERNIAVSELKKRLDEYAQKDKS